MLLDYHRGIRAGRLTMRPRLEVVREGPSTALVDGGGGLGHVPADTAMKLAVAKCRASGLAAVAVRNSGHFGAAGTYAAMAARAGFIGVVTTNNRIPALVPTLGLQAVLGTNPLAVAAPAGRNRPFLLDMATSTVPIGRLMSRWRSGRAIPRGWASDPAGRAVTSGRVAARYRLLTPLGSTHEMGSHKGYGLAAAVEILSSVLPGLRSGAAVDAEARVGHFVLALDPGRFRGAGEFEADLDGLLDALRASRPVDPARPVLVAGDPEYATGDERRRTGIPLSRGVLEDLRSVCRASGVPPHLTVGAG
jgi:LDH2 family malate/lactate/ureidoglycolate dehydrogenase